MNQRLVDLFIEYDDCHQHETNRLTHKIAIPLIFFNLLVMLDWVSLFSFNLAGGVYSLTLGMVALILFAAWYFKMSFKLGLILLPVMLAMLALGAVTPVWLVIVLGVIGWVVQMMGHLIWEKNSPNFMTNMIQFLVGPIFFVALLTGDWKIGKYSVKNTPVNA